MSELPPGPRAPAAINTARLVRRPLESLLGWQKRFGDVFTVNYLIFGTGVYVADPTAIRELLTGDQSDLHAGEANAPCRRFSATTRYWCSTARGICVNAGSCCLPFRVRRYATSGK